MDPNEPRVTSLYVIYEGQNIPVLADAVQAMPASGYVASASQLGCVKINGGGLGIMEDGTLYVTGGGELNPATTTTLGGVIIGDGFTISNTGLLDLAPATDAAIGGVMVGDGLTITTEGLLSLKLPTASTSVKGGFKVGSAPTVTDGYAYRYTDNNNNPVWFLLSRKHSTVAESDGVTSYSWSVGTVTVLATTDTEHDVEYYQTIVNASISPSTGRCVLTTNEFTDLAYDFTHNRLVQGYVARVLIDGDIAYADVSNLQQTLTLDAEVTQGSDNPVIGGAVYTAIQAGLATKQNVLTFDDAPMAGSNNPVKSSGINAALLTKQDIFQQTTLPSAASHLDQIFQYVGATGSGLTNGYFYKSDGTDWNQCDVQPASAVLSADGTTIVNNNDVLSVGTVPIDNLDSATANLGDVISATASGAEWVTPQTLELWQHNYRILYYNYTQYPSIYGCFWFYTNSQTPMTFSEICAWLVAHGYTSVYNPYPCVSGVENSQNRYVSKTSGGANDTAGTITSGYTGMFYDTANSKLVTVFNYGSTETVYEKDSGTTQGKVLDYYASHKVTDMGGLIAGGSGVANRVYHISKTGNYGPTTNLTYEQYTLSEANGYSYTMPDGTATTPSAFYAALRQEADPSIVYLQLDYQSNSTMLARLEIQYGSSTGDTRVPIFTGMHTGYWNNLWRYYAYRIDFNGTNWVYTPSVDLLNPSSIVDQTVKEQWVKIQTQTAGMSIMTILQNAAVLSNANGWYYFDAAGDELTMIQLLSKLDSNPLSPNRIMVDMCDQVGGHVYCTRSCLYNGSEHAEYTGFRWDGSNFYAGRLHFSNGNYNWSGLARLNNN